MSTWLILLLLATVAVTVVVPALHVFLGFKGSDFLFLAAAIFPTLWPSRMDQNGLTIAESEFPLTWGLLAGLAVLLVIPGYLQSTRRIAGRAWFGPVAGWVLVLATFLLSVVVNADRGAELVQGVHACGLILIPFGAAWSVMRASRIDEARLERLILALLGAGCVVAVMSVATGLAPQLFRGLVASMKTQAETGRAFSPIGGPNTIAIWLLMAYSLATGLLLAGRRRFWAVAVIGISFAGLLMTLARAAMLTFLLVNVFLYGRYWRGLGRRVLVSCLLAGFVLGPMTYLISRAYSLERFGQTTELRTDSSVELRRTSLLAALRYGSQHPLFGGGWGLVYPYARVLVPVTELPRHLYLAEYPTAVKPHNLYAMVFAECGVTGMAAFLFFLVMLWRGVRGPDWASDPSGHAVIHGFRGGLFCVLFMSLFQDDLFLASRLAFLIHLFVFLGVSTGAFYRSQGRNQPATHVLQSVSRRRGRVW